MKLCLISLICTILSVCDGYRILGLFPFHGKSHFVMFEHLMKALARKGHQVDVLSTFPLKKPYPNYTDVVKLPVPEKLLNNLTFEGVGVFTSAPGGYIITTMLGNPLCEFLGDQQLQRLLKNPPKDPPYDAVIVEVRSLRYFCQVYPVLGIVLIKNFMKQS